MTRQVLLFLVWMTACGGTTLQTVEDGAAPKGGTRVATAGAGANGGASVNDAGRADVMAAAGEPAVGPANGGVAGDEDVAGATGGGASPIGGADESPLGGARSANEGGAPAGTRCVTDANCRTLNSACTYGLCNDGACAIANVALGALVRRNVPADCHDTVCDGNGGEVALPDVDNAPESTDACTRKTCSNGGDVVATPSPAGVTCSAAGGAKLCDGAGQCVACLAKSDCELGDSCVQNRCVSDSCQDGFRDKLETDVDCGGPCAPCAVLKDCRVDADCVSQACDAVAPHRCLADHCQDHNRSGDESDVDCGGSCPKCPSGFCKVDADCVSNVCMKARGSICLDPRCVDGVQQSNETDVDCGGGICNGCANGQKCQASWDCASGACNLLTQLCQADHCTDYHTDGDETDNDCGGSCVRCAIGKRCTQTADCQAGLKCWPGFPHVCL